MEFSTVYNTFNILIKIIWTKVQILAAEVRRIKAIEVQLNDFYRREMEMVVEAEEEGAAGEEEGQEVEGQEKAEDRMFRQRLTWWYTPSSNYGFHELFAYGRRLDVLTAGEETVRRLTRRYRHIMREIVNVKRLIKLARLTELYDAQPNVERINWVSL